MAQTITTHHISVMERVMKVCAMEEITAKPHVQMDISLIRSAPFSGQVSFYRDIDCDIYTKLVLPHPKRYNFLF